MLKSKMMYQALLFIIIMVQSQFCQAQFEMEKMQPAPSKEENLAMKQTEVDSEFAVIETNYGAITLGFFPDVAPNHVARFKALVREGFYDGVLFHRVIPGFMIQTGDPNSKKKNFPRAKMGSGGSDKPDLKGEFNTRTHLRGTLAAARSKSLDSANSQFYICVAPQPRLDALKYTVYGHVLSSMDVVDAISKVERDQRDNPIQPVQIKKVTIKKRINGGASDHK